MEHKSILRSQSSMCSIENDKSQRFIVNKKLYWITALPKRHILALYAFFGFFFAYSLRSNLSVAIVQMSISDEANYNASYNLSHETVKLRQTPGNRIEYKNFRVYFCFQKQLKWSSISQGYILSSFFYGYIMTQLPAGL